MFDLWCQKGRVYSCFADLLGFSSSFVLVPIGCYNQFGFDLMTLNKNALWCENENTQHPFFSRELLLSCFLRKVSLKILLRVLNYGN